MKRVPIGRDEEGNTIFGYKDENECVETESNAPDISELKQVDTKAEYGFEIEK